MIYATDGSINVTVVDGSVYTGLYAPDGSWNVVVSDGTYTGRYHPCGALLVTVDVTGALYSLTLDGSLYVQEAPYSFPNSQKVTAVTGNFVTVPTIALSASVDIQGAAQGTTIGVISGGTGPYTVTDATNQTQINVDGVTLEVGSVSPGVGSATITLSDTGTPAAPDKTETINTVPQAPTLDLPATSDLGTSSTDNITSDNTPDIDFTFNTTPVAGDVVDLYDGATLAKSYTLTSTDVTNGFADLALTALSDGVHSFTGTHSRSSLTSAASGALSVTIDTAAPVLSSFTGAQNGTTDTQADLSVTTNKGEGTIYWVATTDTGTPTDAQIIAGEDATGLSPGSGLTGSASVSATGVQTATPSGLTTGTWKAFAVQTDVAGNTSSVASSASWSQTVASFSANAVHLDGSTYLRNAAPSGLVNGKKGIMSLWVQPTAGNGTQRYLTFLKDAGGAKFFPQLNVSNVDVITGRNATSASILTIQNIASTPSIVSGAGWFHIIFTWDLSTAFAQCYINGTSTLAASKTLTNDTLVYAATNIDLFSNAGATTYTGDVAEYYLNLHDSIDLSVAANLQKFYSSTGHPVDLGSNGSTPTGTQPEIYLGGSHNYTNWQTNLGSCGNFTIPAGALTSATAP